jgi:hypothetical protein
MRARRPVSRNKQGAPDAWKPRTDDIMAIIDTPVYHKWLADNLRILSGELHFPRTFFIGVQSPVPRRRTPEGFRTDLDGGSNAPEECPAPIWSIQCMRRNIM